MPVTPASSSNLDISIRLKEKFEAYGLGLIFTILGLSIQTAKLGGSTAADALEVGSWVLLLISGMSGLARMEELPEAYRLFSLSTGQEEIARSAQRAQLQGQREVHILEHGRPVLLDKFISDAEEGVEKVRRALTPLETRLQARYREARLAFVFGIGSLMLSSAMPMLERLADALRVLLA